MKQLESPALIKELAQSIEGDYEKTLRSNEFAQWQDDVGQKKEEGINFDDENPWGM